MKCKSCGGDGIERCSNPDHGLIDALSFCDTGRIGCPCCGHDELFRVKHWDAAEKRYVWNACPDCGGSGVVPDGNALDMREALHALPRYTEHDGSQWVRAEQLDAVCAGRDPETA